MGPNHRHERVAPLTLGAVVALAGLASCAKILGVEPIIVDEKLLVDAEAAPSATCEFPRDCPELETVPRGCAVATCVNGACAYQAADNDGDGRRTAHCEAPSGAAIKLGDDCDDTDANLFPGREAECAENEDGKKIVFPSGAPVGACKLGKKRCNEDGTVSACLGAVGPAPVTACTESIDEGCTGNPMEKCPCTTGQTVACGTSGVGACRKGISSCVGTEFGPCEGNIEPAARDCATDFDKNCNGTNDSAEAECACVGGVAPGGKRACNTHPQDGKGQCKAGSQTCTPSGTSSTWSPCAGDVGPQMEQCDAVDRDCNGTLGINEPAPPAPAGTMNCAKLFKCPASGRGPMYYRNGVGWTNYAGSSTIWTGYATRGNHANGTAPPGQHRISRDASGTKMGPYGVASDCCGAAGCPGANIYYDGEGQFYTLPP